MKNVTFRSERLNRLGSAIFAEVAEWKQEARCKGLSVINLDIGSPDQPVYMRMRDDSEVCFYTKVDFSV